MPFGWLNSPYYFQELTKPLLNLWRNKYHYTVTMYCDDGASVAKSTAQARDQGAQIRSDLDHSGLQWSPPKSNFDTPLQQLDHIGFEINWATGRLGIRARRRQKILDAIESLLASETATAKALAALCGPVMSTHLALGLEYDTEK